MRFTTHRKPKLLILDVDGVLTDGTKTYDTQGNVVSKKFNDKDFTAIKMFKASEIEVCFLSGDKNINQAVANNRNIDFYYSRLENGNLNKASFVGKFSEIYKVSLEEMIFVGDDYFDIEIMTLVGLSFCPKDSPKLVKDNSNPLKTQGGKGVVAELYQICLDNFFVELPSDDKIQALDKKEKQ